MSQHTWAILAAFYLVAVAMLAPTATAQESAGSLSGQALGVISSDLRTLEGRRIQRVVVDQGVGTWRSPAKLTSVSVGTPFNGAVARRAARELLASGGFASVQVEARPGQNGVILRLLAVPRRLIDTRRLVGSMLPEDDVWRELGLRTDDELTEVQLGTLGKRLEQLHRQRGWPSARVSVQALPTGRPLHIVLVVHVTAGPEVTAAAVRFQVNRPFSSALRSALSSYEVTRSDRIDERRLARADRALEHELRKRHYLQAHVEHDVRLSGSGTGQVNVRVHIGPLTRLRFEGNLHFDADQLGDAASKGTLPEEADTAAERIKRFYQKRGWWDITVRVSIRGGASSPVRDWVFSIREGTRVRVMARAYPCLGTGAYDRQEIEHEVDAVLKEQLPSENLLQAVDPHLVDETYGPGGTTGTRPVPLPLDPVHTYDASAYDKVVEHLQDMFHSEGYLRAKVMPARLIRGQCRGGTRSKTVRPERSRPHKACDAPVSSPCEPRSKGSVVCCSRVRVQIPIHLGPRANLYDVSFKGNRATTNRSLLQVAGLSMGQPVSNLRVEQARRKILEAYLEEGYAYARVQAVLTLSKDGTRARATYTIHESARVFVDDIRIIGARRTDESLIRDRIALTKGGPYKRSLVRKTEQRLGSLGVFTSVAVSLQDPHTPAIHKTVLIQVQERPAQYMEIRPGFATGEGFRAQLEYGHLNIAGEAIQLTLRARLSYLADPLIQDPTVRANLTALPLSERLERRDTATLHLPQIGLGPLVSFSVTGVDARSNERDFGMTKAALSPMFHYRPVNSLRIDVGGSLERNNATVFGGQSIVEYLTRPDIAPGLQQLLLVPDGLTYVVAQQVSASWDIRDNGLEPTRGILIQGTVEHVHAFPGEDALLTIRSDFLRTSVAVSTYAPLGTGGITVAAKLRAGRIFQLLADSATYPDRLFFLGGVDSLRGFQIDSLMAQDLADAIDRTRNLSSDSPEKVTPRSVAIRGGDAFINPRLEIRFPLQGALHSAVFVDAGNVWRDPSNVQLWDLRYTAGTGLRIQTPIGPIAFDYGINLMRRSWEDAGAFHFSIGLF